MRLPSILRTGGFARLLAGQGISALGDWMATIAFMAITHALTGSATAVGGILVLRLAPGAVAAPLAGRLAHRFGRRRTMLSMDLARAAIALVVPLHLAVWWLYVWAFLIEVASLLFLPARDSSIPELIDEKKLPLANSLVLALSYGTMPLAAGLFAVVSALVSGSDASRLLVAIVFVVDAATFVASFAFIRTIEEIRDENGEPSPDPSAERKGAFSEAFRIPLVRAVTAPMLTVTFALGALFSLGIALVQQVLGASNTEFAALIALFGIGGAAGIAILEKRGERRLEDLRVSVVAIGLMIFLTVLAPWLPLALTGAVGFGAAAVYSIAGGMSVLQERLEGEDRILAFTTFHVLIRALLGLGAIAAGLLADLLGAVALPLLGDLHPARLVLLGSGLVVLLSAPFVHEPKQPETQAA